MHLLSSLEICHFQFIIIIILLYRFFYCKVNINKTEITAKGSRISSTEQIE